MSILRSSSNTQYDDDGDPGLQTDRAYAQLDLPAAIALAEFRERAGTVDFFAAGRRTVFDAAYDAQGVLHLAYFDPSDAKVRYTARLTDGRWTSAQLIDRRSGVGQSLSLALDPTGKPNVAYYDATNGDLKYAYFNGSSWSSTILDSKGTTGQQPSLTFTADGDPAIAYYRKSSTDLKLVTYSHLTGRWTRETVDSDGEVGKSPSIAYFRERTTPRGSFTVNNYDTLAIAYADESDGDLKYWSRSTTLGSEAEFDSDTGLQTGSKIVKVGSDYVARSTVQDLDEGVDSIALSFLDVGGVGSARIAYRDLENADVRYASRARGAWQSIALATEGSVGSNIDTYVDDSGSHHVVYYDSSREATFDAGITTSIGRGFVTRAGSGGSFAVVAARRDGTNVALVGLNRSRDSFGVSIIN
jgi:hypothetical protein